MKWTAFNAFGVLGGSDKALWWNLQDGKLINRIETEAYLEALEWARKLFAAGVVHPDDKAGKTANPAGTRFTAGKLLVYNQDLSDWFGKTSEQRTQNPDFEMAAMDIFTHDGGDPLLWAVQPANIFTFVSKKASEQKIKDFLAVANFCAAPFGTKERLLAEYGVEGTDFTLDKGVPTKTTKGVNEVLGAFDYTGKPAAYVAHPDFPEVTRGHGRVAAAHGRLHQEVLLLRPDHHRTQPLVQPRRRLRAAGGRRRTRPEEGRRRAAGGVRLEEAGRRRPARLVPRAARLHRLGAVTSTVPRSRAGARTGESVPAASGGAAGRRGRSLRIRFRRDRTLILMTLPVVLLLLVFNYVPILGNVVAFQDYDPYLSDNGFVAVFQSPWVGFEQFQRVFDDPEFWHAVQNTFVLFLLQLVLFFPVPIALALLINSVIRPRVRAVAQAIMYLPHFFSWVLVVTVFQQIFGGAGDARADPARARALRLRHHDRPLGLQIPGDGPDGLEGRRLGHHRLPRRARRRLPRPVRGRRDGRCGALAPHVAHHAAGAAAGDRPAAGAARRRRPSPSASSSSCSSGRRSARTPPRCSTPMCGGTASATRTSASAAAAGLIKGVVGLTLVLVANKVAHLMGEQGVYEK